LERELLEHRNSEAEAVLVETTIEVKEAIEPHLEMVEGWLQFKVCFLIQSSATHYYVIKQFGNLDEIAQKAGESY
jgi:ribonuclease G